MSYSYIGGADGPTSVFVAGKLGVSWLNIFGLVIPTLLFLLSGCTLRHVLLIITAIIFGVGHIYVIYVNAKLSEDGVL